MKKKMHKKGMSQFLGIAIAFGVGIVGFVIVVILLQSLLTSNNTAMCSNAAHVFNISSNTCNLASNVSATSPLSTAGNLTTDGLIFADNFSNQWGLAGTILGYVLVLSILALIGVGGYMGWRKMRGSR